ncbi:MAG: FAD-dependent oxidoreductase [Bryobacterales bacterium]|nr:FAD-dependent oxidoreductase [Bryobacterales bacterium]
MQVAVIGGGIIGASIGWRLAQRGARVTILEARQWGAEASWAAAGMLAPGAEVTAVSPWADMALASARLYAGFLRELEAESGVRIDYRPTGGLEVFAGEAELAQLAARAEPQRQLGIVSHAVTAAEAMALAPSLRPPAGAAEYRFYPDDATVNPREIMDALRVVCGPAVREQAPVRAVLWRGGRAHVELESGGEPLVFDAAVLAAGAWSAEVDVAMPVPSMFPVRGHLLGYDLPPGSLGPILRRGHTYLLQRSGGAFIAGASMEHAGFDRTIDPSIVATLQRNAVALFGQLDGLEPRPWVGFRPATGSGLPEIRPLSESAPRIWLACGHYRNGILLAPETARLVTAGLCGGL